MSNLFTQSLPTFSQSDVQNYFLTPLFTGEDIRSQVTVLDNVKGTRLLDFFGALSKITKADSVGFSATGSIAYTQKTLTVKHLKAEIEQNAQVFRDTVKGQLLAKGYSEDDLMNAGVLRELLLSSFQLAVKRDLVRQMWFNDSYAETYSGAVRTGTANADYNVYTGFWALILNDFRDSLIPSSQKISITPSTAAVAQAQTETLSSTSGGTITLTISDVAYSQAFTSTLNATVTAFYTNNVAALKARNIKLTNPSNGVLKFEAYNPGEGFTIVETSAGTGGTWTSSAVTANTQASATMAADTALNTFQAMYDAATPELLEMDATGELQFHVTRSLYANYRNTLQKLNGSESAYTTLVDGKPILTWNGIPVVQHPEWDVFIAYDLGGVYPHRAMLTTPKNLIFGCDGTDDEAMVETWYNPDLQMRRVRAKYKAGTQYVHDKYLVIALG